MATMRHSLAILFIILLIEIIHSEVTFDSVCSPDVEVSGMSSTDGNDVYAIDLSDTKFSPEDAISVYLRQIRPNYGINEFVIRAFDHDGNVVGRFDDPQISNLMVKHHTCPNGATAVYADHVDSPGYREIPLTWRATGVHQNLDEIIFRAGVVSNRQLYRVKATSLKRRLPPGTIPFSQDQSINIDQCGESQGCLVVPQQCNNAGKCEYTLSWQALDDERARFHIVARAQGFVGVGFSKDEKRGDDQVILCAKDAQGHVSVYNMFVSVQSPQYVFRGRPSYGLRDAEGYSNGPHIICKFEKSLAAYTDDLVEDDERNRGRIDRERLVDLRQPHYIYPIYSDEDLVTAQGMRIPFQDISIVNNHPVNFQRRLWQKSHPEGASVLAKIHAILNIIAWVLFASAGVMIARYFDSLWPEYERQVVVDGTGAVTGETVQRRRRFSYFTILPPIMTLVAILTWIAFFCILFELNWRWTSGTHHMWHSILGVIVLVCAFLAPIIGVLRPVPHTKPYCIWYWIHWLVVSLAHCLAIPVIFLGMDNRRLDLWTWCSWLLFGWCIFHFIVQLIFEIHACCYARREYGHIDEGDHYREKHPGHRIRRERVPGEGWKPALLGIYLLVTLIVVIILILAVVFYEGY
ncbi:unnamed protein product [Rotaria sordida]|uniref:DOMON domain-containing protein n=1 Tax=Rotaria sordida TaxID=392033 RepID=A0A813ZED0_9BILA|nr:unnamed protein product [Rotaria sordida]CAF3913653.1 unnamed protein product [Rotaria sordida]